MRATLAVLIFLGRVRLCHLESGIEGLMRRDQVTKGGWKVWRFLASIEFAIIVRGLEIVID